MPITHARTCGVGGGTDLCCRFFLCLEDLVLEFLDFLEEVVECEDECLDLCMCERSRCIWICCG